MTVLPEELKEEHDSLIAAIYEAFSGVDRVGGISWSQSWAHDDLLTDDAVQTSGEADKDTNWEQLVGNEIFYGVSSWVYLDATGFRYYLPPMLLCCLGGEFGGDVESHLTMPPEDSLDEHTIWLRNHRIDQWSLLTQSQKVCITRFLNLMSYWQQIRHPKMYRNEWKDAYESYWSQFET